MEPHRFFPKCAVNFEAPAGDKASRRVSYFQPVHVRHASPSARAELRFSSKERYRFTGSVTQRKKKSFPLPPKAILLSPMFHKMARPPASPLSWRGRASPPAAGLPSRLPSRLPTARSPRPGCSRRGGDGPRPAPGGAEANGRRGGGGRPPSLRRPPYIRARAAPPPRPSGLLASGTAV